MFFFQSVEFGQIMWPKNYIMFISNSSCAYVVFKLIGSFEIDENYVDR